MKTISNTEIEKIWIESDKLKGTDEYNKYYMATDIKTDGKWSFSGWSVPMTNTDGIIKTVKEKTYLIVGYTRYEIRDIHKELLNI